ncbi:MAG: tyrosine-protein kinase family protein [Burkholderiales bacterium]|nr:tyrosine-protein kinase family protein [Burkholderiales bacterium]
MNLIEQAAKRLEELKRAGAELDAAPAAGSEAALGATPAKEAIPTPEAAMLGLRAAAAAAPSVREAGAQAPAAVPPASAAKPARAGPAADAQRDGPLRLDLDLERLKSQGMVTPDAPRTQIADEFRVIKRPVVRNALGRSGARVKNGNLVMVTSSLPGEGKTFTAINLALSIAMELDTTVLLVDGDVAHPDFPKRLGARNSPGLLELLTRDDLEVADVLVRTNIHNLSIIPAGAPHRRATELLASEQMATLLRELASRYPDRVIVFDSPPLLATTEARVLATHMGQIVMVVAADSTRQQAVNLALSTIENCDVVLMVLNKADKTDVGAYYGYYGDEVTTP